MNNESFAGDSLSFSVGRNSKTASLINVSGWFDVKHQSGATGKITDHSGPNCILLDGVRGMLAGLTTNPTANDGGVESFRSGILVSPFNGDIGRGAVATIVDTAGTGTAFPSCVCSTGLEADADSLFPKVDSSPITGIFTNDADFDGRDGDGDQVNGGGGIFLTNDPIVGSGSDIGADIFTTVPGSAPTFTITGATVVMVADVTAKDAQVINGIFVVNQGAADPSSAGIKPLAGRTVFTGGEDSENFTPAITMQDTDTLSITYALSIVVA